MIERDEYWEIGSHFDDSSVLPGTNPSLGLQDVALLESARQALTCISDALHQEGYQQLVMPTHHCASMITPFLSRKWHIAWAPVTSEWALLPPPDVALAPERTLIYSLSFFGVPESGPWLDWVLEFQSRGAKVLSDETHRVGSRWLPHADFHVASLRKMLPVPDGAVLTGVDLDRLPPAGKQGSLRWRAMRLKGLQVSSQQSRTYHQAFEKAERVTEQDVSPARASARTSRLLRSIDIPAMLEARRRNALALTRGLSEVHAKLTTASADVPSHAVIQHHRASRLRSYLVARRVYAPVHWPKGPVAVPGGWRTDILSLPVDHRYTPQDMDRVSEIIADFERGKNTC